MWQYRHTDQMYCKNDELYHGHKYIKKVRRNGKWVYYYDDPKLQKMTNTKGGYVTKTSGSDKSGYGTYEGKRYNANGTVTDYKKTVKKSNSLFSSKTTFKTGKLKGDHWSSIHVTENVGLIRQGVNAVGKSLKKLKKKTKKAVENGKKALHKLFRKITNTEPITVTTVKNGKKKTKYHY